MQKLRVLTAANNAINQLPAGIARLRLESLDLFGNPLQLPDKETVTINNLGVPSLVDLSACVIRTQRWVARQFKLWASWVFLYAYIYIRDYSFK